MNTQLSEKAQVAQPTMIEEATNHLRRNNTQLLAQ